tara:strand:- start:101 stop:277 length:177 start_codon:yes stop_codon:yes gene_type:complete
MHSKGSFIPVIADPDDPNELAIKLPDSLCESQGWAVGDTLEWTDNNDGSWLLKKQSAV